MINKIHRQGNFLNKNLHGSFPHAASRMPRTEMLFVE
jgi:hypothetical protein